MSGLEAWRRDVAAVHHLGDVVADVLGPVQQLGVTVQAVQVVRLPNKVLIAGGSEGRKEGRRERRGRIEGR